MLHYKEATLASSLTRLANLASPVNVVKYRERRPSKAREEIQVSLCLRIEEFLKLR